MNEVFAIASLVITVSGATYMVIAGFRDCFETEISQMRDNAADEISTIKQSPNKVLRDNAKIKQELLQWWTIWWQKVFAVPTYAFAILAFILVIHVLAVCWCEPANAPSLWPYYKWGLAAITVLDIACATIIRAVPFRLRSLARGLHGDFNVRKNEIDLQQQSFLADPEKPEEPTSHS